MKARPNFIDSPFFVMEEDNWHLKPGAPPEVVKEFNRWNVRRGKKNGRTDRKKRA